MPGTNKSRFNHTDRQSIVNSIENMKSESDYKKIFQILTLDNECSYTVNSNGIFLNLSVVSDDTLDKINRYLAKVDARRRREIKLDVDAIPAQLAAIKGKKTRAYKLSNYEKSILRQKNLNERGKNDCYFK